jgi:hypothetical protein
MSPLDAPVDLERAPASIGARPIARYGVLLAFAGAMGWFEAVVVVYLRGLLGIGRQETIPTYDETIHRLSGVPWLLGTEQGRELATMIMLLAIAYLAASRWPARIGAYLIAFGVWDIVYYASLWTMLRWPASLATMDLLFLLPPHRWWYQPVWLPASIACVMTVVGTKLFFESGPPRG